MNNYLIVPQGKGSDTFLELARTPKTQGRLFRKHILSKGTLHYKGNKIEIDDDFLATVVKNFHDKKCDIVQVPIVGDSNAHSEDPLRNIGEVVDLSVEDGKLYSYIDVRKHADDVGKTLIGVSAMLAQNYEDTDTGTFVGPTLLHVAVTNRPHVLNLEEFEEVIAASNAAEDKVVLLSEQEETIETTDDTTEENQKMDLETLIATLKSEHEIDLPALQEKATLVDELEAEKAELATAKDGLETEIEGLKAEAIEREELAVSLSNGIREHLSGIISLSADDASAENLIGAIADAGEKIVTLSGRVEALEKDKMIAEAEAVVDALVLSGHILPKSRADFVELRLTNAEMFDKIVPETPIIELSQENGSEESIEDNLDVAQAEVNRLLGRD